MITQSTIYWWEVVPVGAVLHSNNTTQGTVLFKLNDNYWVVDLFDDTVVHVDGSEVDAHAS